MTQWSDFRQAFEILGIEQTTDRRAIKRAYAQIVKKYHPEEKPEEWQRVHDAYEEALRYVEWNTRETEECEPKASMTSETETIVVTEAVKRKQPAMKQTEPPISEIIVKQTKPPISIPIKAESVSDIIPDLEHKREEAEIDFDAISKLAQHNRVKRKQEWEKALPVAMELLAVQCTERIQTVKQWKKLLKTSEVQMVRTNNTFLYRVGDLLHKCRVGTGVYRVIKKFLEDVYEEMILNALDAGIAKVNLEAWEMARNGLEWAYRGALAQYDIADVKRMIRSMDIGAFCRKHYKKVLVVAIVMIFVIAKATAPRNVERGTNHTGDTQVVFNQTVQNIDMRTGTEESLIEGQASDQEKQVNEEESKESTTSQKVSQSNKSPEEVLEIYNTVNMDLLKETMSNTIKHLTERPEAERYKVWEK